MKGKPVKLASGRWGARVVSPHGPPLEGDLIEIVTRTGKRWLDRVAETVWSDADGGGTWSASSPRPGAPDRPRPLLPPRPFPPLA